MGELPTVEIQSLTDASEKRIINLADFDATIHTAWSSAPDSSSPVATPSDDEPESRGQTPSVPDYVQDDDGNVTHVNVIDPNRPRARLELAVADYDPDVHELWSTHSRFHTRES